METTYVDVPSTSRNDEAYLDIAMPPESSFGRFGIISNLMPKYNLVYNRK
jgi:hypothetical protein